MVGPELPMLSGRSSGSAEPLFLVAKGWGVGSMCGEIWVPRLTLGGEGDRDGVGQCDGGVPEN